MAKLNTICYELVDPIVYNKGTQWEKHCSKFLKYYVIDMTKEEIQKRVDTLNAQSVKMEEGREVKRYFADSQEEMY